jgi:DNA-binding MarR family transcriptional regulator
VSTRTPIGPSTGVRSPAPGPRSPDVDLGDLAGSLRLSVTRLARLLRQQDQSGLAPTLTAALATIAREGPLTLGELAVAEQVTAPSITKVVEKLEARGFVTRHTDERDRRVTRVQVTPAGRKFVETVRGRRTAWLTSRLKTLSPDELARLAAAADVLEKLTTADARPEPGSRGRP